MDFDYCEIVRDSLNGRRQVDEQTFASLEILTERLQRIKKLDKRLEAIVFSRDVQELSRRRAAAAVS